jgi:hypothetical protein
MLGAIHADRITEFSHRSFINLEPPMVRKTIQNMDRNMGEPPTRRGLDMKYQAVHIPAEETAL